MYASKQHGHMILEKLHYLINTQNMSIHLYTDITNNSTNQQRFRVLHCSSKSHSSNKFITNLLTHIIVHHNTYEDVHSSEKLTVFGVSGDAFDVNSRRQIHKRIGRDYGKLIADWQVYSPSRRPEIEREQLLSGLNIPYLGRLIGTPSNQHRRIPYWNQIKKMSQKNQKR